MKANLVFVVVLLFANQCLADMDSISIKCDTTKIHFEKVIRVDFGNHLYNGDEMTIITTEENVYYDPHQILNICVGDTVALYRDPKVYGSRTVLRKKDGKPIEPATRVWQ